MSITDGDLVPSSNGSGVEQVSQWRSDMRDLASPGPSRSRRNSLSGPLAGMSVSGCHCAAESDSAGSISCKGTAEVKGLTRLLCVCNSARFRWRSAGFASTGNNHVVVRFQLYFDLRRSRSSRATEYTIPHAESTQRRAR